MDLETPPAQSERTGRAAMARDLAEVGAAESWLRVPGGTLPRTADTNY